MTSLRSMAFYVLIILTLCLVFYSYLYTKATIRDHFKRQTQIDEESIERSRQILEIIEKAHRVRKTFEDTYESLDINKISAEYILKQILNGVDRSVKVLNGSDLFEISVKHLLLQSGDHDMRNESAEKHRQMDFSTIVNYNNLSTRTPTINNRSSGSFIVNKKFKPTPVPPTMSPRKKPFTPKQRPSSVKPCSVIPHCNEGKV